MLRAAPVADAHVLILAQPKRAVTENLLGISNSWLISSQKESSCIGESQEFHFLAELRTELP
jgi:hypothetical protein